MILNTNTSTSNNAVNVDNLSQPHQVEDSENLEVCLLMELSQEEDQEFEKWLQEAEDYYDVI